MKKNIVNIILAVCFLIFLFNLNGIIGLFRPTPKVCSFPETNSVAAVHIDSFNCDSHENVVLTGWAFAETEEDNSGKTINVILQGDNFCYSFEDNTLGERKDVRTTMEAQGYTIQGIEHGVVSIFSTVNVKSGIYNIYMLSAENSESSGIAYTGYQIVKHGREVSIRENRSGLLSTAIPEEWKEALNTNEKAFGSVDILDVQEDEKLYATGWAFCETEQDNSNKAITLILRTGDRTFAVNTRLKARPDVYNAYQNSRKISGDQHGFVTEVDLSTLPDGEYELQLYCEEAENVSGLYSSGKWVKKAGDSPLEILDKKPEASIHTETPVVPVKASGAMDSSSAAVSSHVDILKVQEDGNLYIEGWAFCETEQDNSGKTIRLLLEGDRESYCAETTEKPREDVTQAYQSSKKIQGDLHGFKSILALDSLPDGKYQILIHCQETPDTSGISQTGIQIELSGGQVRLPQ